MSDLLERSNDNKIKVEDEVLEESIEPAPCKTVVLDCCN